MNLIRCVTMAGLLGIGIMTHAQAEDLVLQAATQNHPHVRAILDGRVKVQGCELHFSTQSMTALMNDLTQEKKYDVLEVELLPYLEKKSAGDLQDYTLIPVFLSREFSLRQLFIRTDRGIVHPEDLRGKTVGVSGYRGTSATWLRGVLQSSWNVKPSEITWIDVEESSASVKSLSAGMSSGKLDAAICAGFTQDFLDKNPKVARLFPDFQKVEYAIFHETRIFPITSALAVRKSLIEQNPWLPEALFMAFSEAKQKAMADLTLPLPWGGAQLAETEKLMGKNFWSYGIQSNPKTLGTLFHYLEEQGLLNKQLTSDDVFEPSTIMLMEP